ncbi:hypothetical protein EYF80_056386 [Liparis tanakae]|uniref:Uncharacterized protein n=1 Tax=Liparis tanakae TaxID=230148 RepID=A0A4Z2EXV5_9TELE|nr:hypothetical protein EYF80_056386 [Liparis tanakae]
MQTLSGGRESERGRERERGQVTRNTLRRLAPPPRAAAPLVALVAVLAALGFDLQGQLSGGGQHQHARTPPLGSGPADGDRGQAARILFLEAECFPRRSYLDGRRFDEADAVDVLHDVGEKLEGLQEVDGRRRRGRHRLLQFCSRPHGASLCSSITSSSVASTRSPTVASSTTSSITSIASSSTSSASSTSSTTSASSTSVASSTTSVASSTTSVASSTTSVASSTRT